MCDTLKLCGRSDMIEFLIHRSMFRSVVQLNFERQSRYTFYSLSVFYIRSIDSVNANNIIKLRVTLLIEAREIVGAGVLTAGITR